MVKDPIKLERGNAIAFAGKGYNKDGVLVDTGSYSSEFDVYKDGETTELPKVGDLMVWEEFPNAGHVGVVTEVNDLKNTVTIYNGNSTKIKHTFEYEKTEDNIVHLISLGSWYPDYWVRKK